VALDDTNSGITGTPISGQVLTNDSDPDGDILIVNTTPISGPVNGVVTLNPDGTYTYISNSGFIGTDAFVYEICDPGGLCDQATVIITVIEDPDGQGNDPPVANDDFASTLVNTPVSGNVLTNDFEPDGDLIILNTTPISGPSNGTVTLLPNGDYTYTPAPGFIGIDIFVYEICDPYGLCDQATVVIIIDEDPTGQGTQPPVAVDDYYETAVNIPVDGNVLLNDYDPDDIYLIVNTNPVIDPVNGTVVLNNDGTFTYTPDTDFVGEDTFTYEVCDPGGRCDQAVVTIVVYEDCGSELVCAGTLNVSLQDNCEAVLNLESAAPGFHCPVIIIVEDGVGNDNVIQGCGTYKYSITDANDPNNTCWGFITAEDKQAPVLSYCPSTVSGWSTYDYGFQDFVCDDVSKLLFDEPVTYQLDKDGNLIAGSISTHQAKFLFRYVTGYAEFTDNCGDIFVTVEDELIEGYDPDCDEVTIRRKFTARDACKQLLSPDVCYQSIVICKPTLREVYCPDDAELSCEDELKLDAHGNPHPDVTGYPWLYSAFDADFDPKNDDWLDYDHKVYLNEAYCNIAASYTDGSRIEVCEGTYKIVRTWEILDWCSKEIIECKQIIKVGDSEGPTVQCEEVDFDNDGYPDLPAYSTGPYDCTAAFHVPLPVVKDNCSSWEVLTEIIAYATNGPVVAAILPGQTRYVSGIPLGCHFIRYTVTDDCGNKTVQYCPFYVEDQIEPIAVCDDDLHVSIGGQGLARVYAYDIDEGSSDNCGPIRIEVRRRILAGADYGCLDMFDYDGDGEVIGDEVNEGRAYGVAGTEKYYFTPWLDYVDFTCCDMSENVRIEMRVWDDRNGDGHPGNTIEKYFCSENAPRDVTDNANVCWLDVLIEDKLPAYCVPPLPAYIDCDELPFDFDPDNSEQMSELFGEASGTDNCPGYTVTELAPNKEGLDDCGYGVLIRRFEVADGKGLTSTNKCEQKVTIREQHKYKIKFPKDAEANCGIPDADTIAVEELACDLLAISVKDNFFSASGDECYKIFRTYSVINWCEYDGISDPVVVSRDEDCDGKPGDEDIWVIVMTMNDPDPCHDYYGGDPSDFYSHVWYDKDSDPFNLWPEAGTKGYNCEYETNPWGFWKEVTPITENEDPDKDTDNYPEGSYGDHCDDMASVGYWQYTQVIKVYDNVKPKVEFGDLEPFCSYSSDFEADCPVEVSIDFIIDENCTPDDLTITIYLDAYQDGVLEGDITDLLSGTYPNYNVTGNFPLGAHHLGVSVKDGCGNQIGANIPFEVVDCKAPTPICINGLAVELMPVIPAADADGDGDEDSGAMAIWASDFVASPAYDCTGEVQYSINRVGEEVIPDQTGITLTCDDEATVLIEIWAWDGKGNGDFCETYVLVQDNLVQCESGGNGSISGAIETEEDVAVEGTDVELSGGQFQTMTTKFDGHYVFDDLDAGFDYTVTPHNDRNALNGVSTYDLVLMSKHVLGVELLDSPYKILAADINRDGRITALDAIELRRLILNIDLKFQHNTSWRFVPRAYIFPEPSDPWFEEFPEVININNLQENLDKEDFVALKVGDIDLSAASNALVAEPRTTNGLFLLNVEDQELLQGEAYTVVFRADQLPEIQGYQMTLGMDLAAVEFVDIQYGLAGPANFGFRSVEEGLLTTSWNRKPENTYGEDEWLFSLQIRALRDSRLSEVLQVNSRITVAEAYNENSDLMDVGIQFGNGAVVRQAFELMQNAPNPFRETTTIGFYLPEDGEAILRIHDASGRILKLIRSDFAQGSHLISLDRAELRGSGILYYTLTAGEYTATKKMILIE
ncbi:MAG: tandem-95 repeat protein, partial [Lewinella sp.]|nr:tandem-95 repeat protein [Lewinella sp.]